MSERFEDQLPAELVEDLRWMQAFIRDNPKRFSMDTWLEPSPCGTVGCIAGHIACRRVAPAELERISNDVAAAIKEADSIRNDGRLTLTSPKYVSWRAKATSLMTLVERWRQSSIPAGLQSDFDFLFIPDNWPEEFKTRRGNITPSLAIKRIDYFLETGR